MLLHEPNEAQIEIEEWWFNTSARFCLILGGERAGKSYEACKLALPCMNILKPGRYWIVGPDYQQPRQEFQYIYEALKKGDNGVSLVVDDSVSMPLNIASPWSLKTIWGQEWMTKSASDIQKLASFSVSGVIMSEAAQHIYESYLKLMGRVSETSGFLILSGTLERGLPWYGDLYSRWQGANELNARSFSLPTWTNTDVYPGGEENPRIKELRSEYPEDLFMERFGAKPMRKTGLVLPEYDHAKHVKHMVVNPELPVELWMDPGQHCYPVLFVQVDGLITNILDCVYSRSKIVHDIIPLVMANPLFKYVKLSSGGIIDNAGQQHNANHSQVELWQKIAGVSLRSQYCRLDDTIQAIRFRLQETNPLHQPLLYFNDHLKNTKSPNGLALDLLAEPELWVWPDRSPGRNEALTPTDKNNDGMKAIGYGLIDHFGAHISKPVSVRSRRREYYI